MPLQVSREAMARSICPSGSSLSSAAISRHGRLQRGDRLRADRRDEFVGADASSGRRHPSARRSAAVGGARRASCWAWAAAGDGSTGCIGVAGGSRPAAAAAGADCTSTGAGFAAAIGSGAAACAACGKLASSTVEASAPMRSIRIGPRCDVPRGAAGNQRLAGELVGAERRQRFQAEESCLSVRRGVHQVAVAREERDRLRRRRCSAGARVRRAAILAPTELGRDHQDGRRAVFQTDRASRRTTARAQASRRNRAAVRAAAARRAAEVPAIRAICSAAVPLGSMTWPASAAGEAASKIAAAAVGLAHSTRVASALHSQAGSALVACAANLGSRR